MHTMFAICCNSKKVASEVIKNCRSEKKFIALYYRINPTIGLVGFQKWLIDILIIYDLLHFLNRNIVIIVYLSESYGLYGVHHIHYNKDYNSFSFMAISPVGVHHIHYNKDYNSEDSFSLYCCRCTPYPL